MTAASSRVEVRRAARREEILDAAWELAREEGLVGMSLRSLAERVGVRAPSLYAHFASKDAIYDGMFVRGYEEFRAVLGVLDVDEVGVHATLATTARTFVEFANDDPVRFQLLFQHAIPGWHPSEEAYAAAVDVLADLVGVLAAVGIADPAAVDQWTAIVSGLASQQVANDPGGQRWLHLVDDTTAMFLAWHRPDLSRDARETHRRRSTPATDRE